MDYIQQEINMHKSKLLNLINNLINTQIIDNEIAINDEIKTESECLKSILKIKQNNLMNQQINLNNNLDFSPFMVQPNLQMNLLMNNMNQNQINHNQNFLNPVPKNQNIINVKFFHSSSKISVIQISPDEKILELIKRYREKTQDFEDNWFIFNNKNLNNFLSSSLKELGITDGYEIQVSPKRICLSSL